MKAVWFSRPRRVRNLTINEWVNDGFWFIAFGWIWRYREGRLYLWDQNK